MQWPRFWNDFHSIQTSFNRRFSRGVPLGFNYTLTLRQKGTNDLNATSGLRLVHNADGTLQRVSRLGSGRRRCSRTMACAATC